MKFKTTAIAMAVAGSVATPMAAQAEVYASARVGIENSDTGGISDLAVKSFASRFGAKGETDLGNGMSGFGKYEWDVDFDGATDATNDIKLRHRYVGVKGDFGSVLIGQTYQTFYNFVVGPNDNPWWSSGYAMVSYTGRTDNAITYAGGTDMVSFGVTGYFVRDANEDAPDGYEVGASFGISDMTLGVALQHFEVVDNDVVGLALTGISFGDVSLGFGYQQNDDDDSLLVDAGIGNAYVHIESQSIDATNQDRLMTTLGYTQSLGRNTTAWYEFMQLDNDTGNSDDDNTVLRAVLKYDIL